MPKNTEEQIKQLLQRDQRGLTIQDLSNLLKVSRITVALALAKLEGAGLVDIRKVSAAKLYYWRSS